MIIVDVVSIGVCVCRTNEGQFLEGEFAVNVLIDGMLS